MNIYVGNLSFAMTEDELQQLFAEHGTVTKASIINDRYTGRSKGFGFVEMENDADAEKAISEIDGTEVGGRNIKVNQARPKEDKPRSEKKDW